MQRNVLRARRLKLGLTQKQVAAQLGVTDAFYGMIECGKRTPRLAMAFEIARVLKAKVPDLFPETVSAQPTGSPNG